MQLPIRLSPKDSWAESGQSELESIGTLAIDAGLKLIGLKAVLFAGVLSHLQDSSNAAVTLLESCLPSQLELGHINFVAQELCPRPDLVVLILRRHRSNGLGPPLLEALSRHWRFPEATPLLRELGPSQVGTWLNHLDAGRGALPTRKARSVGAALTDGPSALDELTMRELEVLRLMAQDRSNEEIAVELYIALSTVKTHVNHILRKLGQKKRVGAVLEYQRVTIHHTTSPPRGTTQNPPWV